MAGLRTRGRKDPTLFSRSAPGSQHALHAVAHRHEAGGLIRLALRNPDAVLIPVDVFDPHGKDLVRSHAAVLQDDHDQPSLLPEPLDPAMFYRFRISLLEFILNPLIYHAIPPRSLRQPELRNVPQ